MYLHENALEPTPEWYWIELGRVGRKIVEELFPIKAGENVVVTADTRSDMRVVQETVKAIYAVGASPTLIIHPTTEVATSDPPPSVIAAVQDTDVWIEFNDRYLLYSNAWKKAMRAGVRVLSFGGHVDGLVRTVGSINYPVLDKLARKLAELSIKAEGIHITTSLGTDLRVKVDPKGGGTESPHILTGDGTVTYEGEGTTQVPPGQSGYPHVPDAIDGILIVDGALFPPTELGVLREPVTLEISHGKITKITGGREAKIFEKWLSSWNHPSMYQIAHCSYGCNPGITRCKGEPTEDERVFGSVYFGIGPTWVDAPAHSDGTILDPSVWADDAQLEEEGQYVHPELVELCRQLGVAGY